MACELLSDVATVVGGLIVDDPDAADSDLHQCAVNDFSKGVRVVASWDDNDTVRGVLMRVFVVSRGRAGTWKGLLIHWLQF